MPVIARSVWITLCSLLLLPACSSHKEPAGRLLGDIQATITAASSEASQYVPQQLNQVQTQLDHLRELYRQGDYAAVETDGPGILGEAQSLATAAAAKKDEGLKALNDTWAALAISTPAEMSALRTRFATLDSPAGKRLRAGLDVSAAKSLSAQAESLWSKAQAAFAAGNLSEAVHTAKDVKDKLDMAAGLIKLDIVSTGAATV